MSGRARIIRILTAGAIALIGAAAVAAPATAVTSPRRAVAVASSAVTVSPSTALAGGQVVQVTGTGIMPSASVQVIQCDTYVGDPEQDCAPTTTATASSSGHVQVSLTLQDPVFRSQPLGDSLPIYCRADNCRVFLAWTGPGNEPDFSSSSTLTFKGAPATVIASTSMNLHGRQLVGVRGTAFGARGHQVMVLEEACFAIIQGSGCYGQLPAVTATVGDNGRYFVHYRVRQFLADGTDCNDPGILGSCELTVIVLTNGHPDDSYGLSSIGQPAAQITFLPKKPSS